MPYSLTTEKDNFRPVCEERIHCSPSSFKFQAKTASATGPAIQTNHKEEEWRPEGKGGCFRTQVTDGWRVCAGRGGLCGLDDGREEASESGGGEVACGRFITGLGEEVDLDVFCCSADLLIG